jgi:hypothetical protein
LISVGVPERTPFTLIATPEIGRPEEVPGKETVPEIVQFVEQLTAVTDNVKVCVAFDPKPLLAVMVIGLTDAPVGVPLIVAVPFPLSTKVMGLGSDPVSVNVIGRVPVVVTVKEPFAPTVNVALLALVICGGTFTVIVTVDVCLLPAELVTVNV